MSLVRSMHPVSHNRSHKHKLIGWLVGTVCDVPALKRDFRLADRVSLSGGNRTWCHRLKTMVSRGMHEKFPKNKNKKKRSLQDDTQFWLVTFAGKREMVIGGRQFRQTSAKI